MYQDMIDDLMYIKKISSEDDYNSLCKSILDDSKNDLSRTTEIIEKQASVATLAVGAGKTIGGLGLKAGKWVAKKPLQRGSSLAFGAMNAKGVVDAAHKELNSGNQFLPKTFPKLARDMDNNFNVSGDKKKNDMGNMKYLPYAAAIPVALAAGYRLKTGKNLMPSSKGVKKAVGDMARRGNLGRPLKSFSQIVDIASKTVNENKNKASGIFGKNGDKLILFSREAQKAVQDAVEKEFSGMSFKQKAKMVNKAIDEAAIGKAVNRHVKDIRDQNSISHKILQGAGLGMGMATSQFAVQSLGDEYFKRKDSDELRALLRGQRIEKSEPKYKTPRQRAFGNYQRNINKEALDKDLMKEIWKNDIYDTAKRSLITAAAPGAISLAINRDIKNNLKKIRPVDSSSAPRHDNKIIIDIPMSSLEKEAAFDIRKLDPRKIDFNKLKLPEATKKKIKDKVVVDTRNAIRSAAWVAPPAAVSYITGRNIRGNFEKLNNGLNNSNELPPVSEGNARIIIETGNSPSEDTNMMDFYGVGRGAKSNISKKATDAESLSDEIKKLTNKDSASRKVRKKISQMNIEIPSRSHQFTMLK